MKVQANETNYQTFETLKKPLYDVVFSILSGAAGGAVVKFGDSGTNYISKKLAEYRQGQIEYKEREVEKIAHVLADKLVEELEKYLQSRATLNTAP